MKYQLSVQKSDTKGANNELDNIRRTSNLKRKMMEEAYLGEGRDIMVTLIEQNFTNFNRCLFIIRIENSKTMLAGKVLNEANANNQGPGAFPFTKRDGGSNAEKSVSALTMKQKVKLSSAEVKEELRNFMFDVNPADQKFQSNTKII